MTANYSEPVPLDVLGSPGASSLMVHSSKESVPNPFQSQDGASPSLAAAGSSGLFTTAQSCASLVCNPSSVYGESSFAGFTLEGHNVSNPLSSEADDGPSRFVVNDLIADNSTVVHVGSESYSCAAPPPEMMFAVHPHTVQYAPPVAYTHPILPHVGPAPNFYPYPHMPPVHAPQNTSPQYMAGFGYLPYGYGPQPQPIQPPAFVYQPPPYAPHTPSHQQVGPRPASGSSYSLYGVRPEAPVANPSRPNASTVSEAPPFVVSGYAFPGGLNRKERRNILFHDVDPSTYKGAIKVTPDWEANHQKDCVETKSSDGGDNHPTNTDASHPQARPHYTITQDAYAGLLAAQ